MGRNKALTVPEPRKLPSGAWFIQLRFNGHSIPVTSDSKKECIAQATAKKAEYKANKKLYKKEDKITLKEVIDLYILITRLMFCHRPQFTAIEQSRIADLRNT